MYNSTSVPRTPRHYRTLVGSHMLPVRRNRRRAVQMTGCVQNQRLHLLTLYPHSGIFIVAATHCKYMQLYGRSPGGDTLQQL